MRPDDPPGAPPRAPSAPPGYARVPWEDGDRPLVARLVATLGDAFRPAASAPRLRGDAVGPAVAFAALVGLPLAFLSGVVPFTHLVVFGPAFALSLQGSPTGAELALDVARAGGLGVLVWIVHGAALAAPFASLSGAYGSAGSRTRALRTMLYRSWLLPLSGQGVVASLGAWAYPAPTWGEGGVLLLAFLAFLPLLLVLLAMRATSTQLNDLGPLASVGLVLLAVIVYAVGDALLLELLEPWLPAVPLGPAPGAPPGGGLTA